MKKGINIYDQWQLEEDEMQMEFCKEYCLKRGKAFREVKKVGKKTEKILEKR